ncbi:MAG: 1,4-dihydroxy-2-naphthoate octaprenyltransferase [Bacteroidetes bacterium MedPE-SWsnd-G2]|nr:MAG: 1,4-dihydroxy-2-naphthoate octaprenyltransferase [Bacteroidetes bacterium MedPE-SWsnd-G2]
MSKFSTWMSAFRLRTLPLSLSGIILGTCFAAFNSSFNTLIFVLALLTTISFQILSNLANDYGDGVKGTDNENRIGPERALQSGEISANQMLTAIKINIGVSIVLAGTLIYVAFGIEHLPYVFLFLVLAIASIYAAMKYTMGSSAYGYRGLGDVFVFLFFGLLGVLGSYFLYTYAIDPIVISPAICLGLLSVGVLNLNNMRDIESDKLSHKMTLAVKLGLKKAKIYQLLLVGGSMILTSVFIYFYYQSWKNLFVFITFLPLIKHMIFVYKTNKNKLFDPQLKVLALSTFFFSIALGLGFVL